MDDYHKWYTLEGCQDLLNVINNKHRYIFIYRFRISCGSVATITNHWLLTTAVVVIWNAAIPVRNMRFSRKRR